MRTKEKTHIQEKEMSDLIVKNNKLIEASYRLGEIEQRLILLAIIEARKVGTKIDELRNKTLTIHAENYVANFGGTIQAAYKALKQGVLGLFAAQWGYRSINDKGNKVVSYERFTQSAHYVVGDGIVQFKFADSIIPMLVQLEKNFTSYEIGQVAGLSSRYAMRLYEMIMRWYDKNTGQGLLVITLEEFRFRLGLLANEYPRMSDFKKGVLDLAIKQINENTDITVSYEQSKRGREITGFTFTTTQKVKNEPKIEQKQQEQDRDPFTVDMFTGNTDYESYSEEEQEQDRDPFTVDMFTGNIDDESYSEEEQQVITEATNYAKSQGCNSLHTLNIQRKALRDYREAKKQEEEKQHAELVKQAQQNERKLKQQEEESVRLDKAMQLYNVIVIDEELSRLFIDTNAQLIKKMYFLGNHFARICYEQGRYSDAVKQSKDLFETKGWFDGLNFDFLNT